MKRSFLILGLFWGVLVLQPAVSRGQTLTPIGTWEVTIQGTDRGTSMMTFSNDMTVTGYGITQKQFGLFSLTGNWGFNSQGDVVVAYVQTLDGTNTAVSFAAQLLRSGRFFAKGTGTSGRFRFKGAKPTDFSDLSGSWVAAVKRGTKTLHETYTISVSSNFPAVFDVVGQGLSDTGSYTLTGEIISASHSKLNASINRTAGLNTVRSSLWGMFKPRKPEMALRGSDDTGAHLDVRAIQ